MKDNLRALINAWRSKGSLLKPLPPDYTARVYVIAHFVQDAAYKQVQRIAEDTDKYGGTPIDLPHLTLAYFGDVADLNVLVPRVEKELRKIHPFSVAVLRLELMPHRSLWLTVARTPRLHSIADRLADIVLWCGYSHRGFPTRNWVPHLLLAKFPPDTQLETSTLPWNTQKCNTLTVNKLLITHQLDENEFEVLAQIPLSAKKTTKPTRTRAKKKVTRAKTTRKKK